MTQRCMPQLCGDRVSFETIEGKCEADVVKIDSSRITLRNVTCVRASGREQGDRPLLIARMVVCRRWRRTGACLHR